MTQYASQTSNGFVVHQNHWAVFVFYSSHIEQGITLSAREAQESLHPLLLECDPGFAYGITVEMHVGDTFPPQQAPEDRRAYFATDHAGNLTMISRDQVYKLPLSA
jgi:hypothetical protein